MAVSIEFRLNKIFQSSKMDLFNENNLNRFNKDESMFKEFTSKKMNIQILSNSDQSTSYESLLEVKYLFQKMLPKMPKDYILRQVFDEHHCCLTLNEELEGKPNVYRIIGAVCYRPCFERNLIEIVFLAIDSDFHIHGYGTFLFNCFKEVCKLQCISFLRIGEAYKDKNVIITDLSIFDSLDSIRLSDLEIGRYLPEHHLPPASENGSYEQHTSKSSSTEEDQQNFYMEFVPKKIKPGKEMHGDKRASSSEPLEEDQHPTQGSYNDNFNIYLLTYADNSAIGFFKKQGFSLYPRSTSWSGYIKDYEGGTLMECKIHKSINYLKKKAIVKQIRDAIFTEMREINDFHVLYSGSDREKLRHLLQDYRTKKDYSSRTKEEFLADFLYFLICTLQTHPSSWPFLDPVSIKDVPDYFEVIKHPMDMGLIMKKIKNSAYKTVIEFSDDIYLMCSNCMSYNGPDTQYYKCAESIRNEYDRVINVYRNTIEKWGYSM